MAKLSSSDLPSADEVRRAISEDRVPETSGEIVQRNRTFDDAALRQMKSFDDAVAFTQSAFGEIVDAAEVLGTGFTVLEKEGKDRLIGVRFLIIEFAFNPSDQFGGEFVSVLVMTEDSQHYILNDGGTGIYNQLRQFHDATGRKGGLMVKGGLRRSDYPANDVRPAGTTYYLNV